jgi:selenide, water dikinase
MQAAPPIETDLVLIGGGHSHAIVLKQFGMNPIPGVRLTLISDVSHTPYSGMLPGYVAGFYDYDDCHIDLRRLSRFARANLVIDQAVGLDLLQNRVLLADHPPIAFDWLSMDIGSTPTTLTVAGATGRVIPVKPISQFLNLWDQLLAQVQAQPRPLQMAVVGGGAGGVELALSAHSRFEQLAQQMNIPRPTLHLLHQGDRLVPERAPRVGYQLHQILQSRGVQVHLAETVAEIVTGSDDRKKICCESGLTLECDQIFWVTQAGAAPWLKQSALATDERGFVWVQDTLQSVSHPQVFAAGDVATMMNHERPKAGVFAVRQGKPLADNLRRVLAGQPPQPFVPQKEFLILIGTADRSALASRGSWTLGPHPLLWRWKDWIDRQFMAKFSDLEPMMATPATRPTPVLPCAGCGSKVSSSVLTQAITRIRQDNPDLPLPETVLIGLDAPDDAAVIQPPAGRVLVQTVDHFRSLLNDPYRFGQICTQHCLSDLYAMGAQPHSALAIVTLPYASEAKLTETLYQLLAGAVQTLTAAGAVLVGGHTTEGNELSFGLTCNGFGLPNQLWRKSGLQPGQALILTKPLGTGALFAAEMQLQAKGRWVESAMEMMLQSNQAAVAPLRQFQATACTDVTGFGLAGHLLEMLQASQVSARINLEALPVLPGVPALLDQGWRSSLYPQNLRVASQIHNLTAIQTHPLFPLLFDPQTSGGLLAAVSADQATACVKALRTVGYAETQIIGEVVPLEPEELPLRVAP